MLKRKILKALVPFEFKSQTMLKTIIHWVAGICMIYFLLVMVYMVTNFVIGGRKYIESFEEVHYDYRLYLKDEHIRIETQTSSEMIHPDSLEEFIIRDNL